MGYSQEVLQRHASALSRLQENQTPSDATLFDDPSSILQVAFMDIQFVSFGEGHSGKMIDRQALNRPENKIKYVIRRHSMIVLQAL
ncbi:hypothetical protein [Salinicoccus roseus]|uniref:hypothetical protein n=1 Tax=Salinicoccus roseus TaxID=45670 RepID=UPI001EF449E9|nr:hypothetical protein [Salinicoccus roseus]MCG7331886.1 hypothetical protein [Salinicoccus roseus]